MIPALEAIGETYAGSLLALLTLLAGAGYAKRALLQKVKRGRR